MSTQNEIYFDTREKTLKHLAYNDSIYAWLLLHSHYKKGERYNYIYKNEFSYKQIGADIHKHRDTVSKRFKELLGVVIYEFEYNGKKAYKMPYFVDFETLDGPTVMALLTLPVKDQKEELIKTYAWLLKQKRKAIETSLIEKKVAIQTFYCSPNQILLEFGHSNGNVQSFDRIRLIFTILQGAGIIRYQQLKSTRDEAGRIIPPQFLVICVNQKASDEWLGIRDQENKEETC